MAISKIIGSGLGTINSPVEFTSADNLAQITLTSTDADATVGPTLKMYRASGSGADNDAIGELNFNFNNDAQEETIGTRMRNFIIDASNGTEDAAFDIFSMKAGALTSIINYDSSTLSFNDGSADIDFRVETNGVADAFFVNGGDNQIEIGVPILMDNSDTGTNVTASSEAAINIRNTSDTNNNTAGIQFQNSANALVAKIGAQFIDAGDKSTDLFFATRVNSGSLTEAMRIDSSQRVLIGTAAIGATADSTGVNTLQVGNSFFNHFDIDAAGTLTVSNNVFFNGTNNKAKANGESSDYVQVGGAHFFRTAPSVSADANATVTERFRIALNGDLTATDTSIASNSDERLKENVSDYTYDIAKFKQYAPKTFDWKNADAHNGRTGNRGFLAQAVKAIDDNWIGEIDVSEYSPDYDIISDNVSLTSKLGDKDAMYISVIQQLIARIETLEDA